MDDLDGMTPGERLKHFRTRAGMSRPVLGGLVGRSGEWVKAVETGRLLTPRLPLLVRIAEVLEVDDLARLTGEQKLTTATFARGAHEALPRVAAALASYPVLTENADPVPAPALAERVAAMWGLWHGTRRQRTAIAGLLPALVHDAQVSARRLDGADRRSALRSLAQSYHLAQLYLSFQPVPELISITGDRAFLAAQDADDPQAIAAAAWYLNHVFRDAGQQHEARVQLAADAASLLRPERDVDDRALWGLLQLAVALSHARVGREGDAWRAWDEASRAARSLPAGYVHPWLVFGAGTVEAYAVTVHVDLMHGREAARQADRVDLRTIPSATRRSFHLVEAARAHHQRREPLAVVHLLRQAHTESPDTVAFNLFARSALLELRDRGGATVRGEAERLSSDLDLPG